MATDDGLIERQSGKLITFKILHFKGFQLHIVKHWSSVCTILPSKSFSILSSFKRLLKETHRDLCVEMYFVCPLFYIVVVVYPIKLLKNNKKNKTE